MGFFDDIFDQPFGGMFDINGDGKTDLSDEWLGYMVINECMKEDEKENPSSNSFISIYNDTDFWQLDCEDGFAYGLSPYDYTSIYEYEAALRLAKAEAQSKKEDWRNYCEEGFDYGIDPNDYDAEDEYIEELEEAKNETENQNSITNPLEVTVPIKLTITVERPGQEELDKIKETEFANKRQYKAAYYLCELQQNIGYIPYNSTKEAEMEKCNFILAAKSIAAKYLTVYGEFLYVQAVKENFDLPISVQDEDEEVVNDFGEFFIEIAEKDPKLALDIWAWVVKEFGSYKKYIKNDWAIYNSILTSISNYSDEFLLLLIKKLGADIKFCNELITENPRFPYGLVDIIAKSLATNHTREAQIIFAAVAMNPKAEAKSMKNLIFAIFRECENWEELETMERFELYILPIIKKMNSNRTQGLLPKLIENINYYIDSVESNGKKYQYSRKYAWRNKYKNNHLYGIDPLDYSTEEEYDKAVQKKKNVFLSEQRLKDLITRIKNGEIWDEDIYNSYPPSLKYIFTYPNGKCGDIDMYISNQLGKVQQVGATEFVINLPTREREKIALLLFIYTVKWNEEPRTEIQEFMYKCNLMHRLRQECDDFMRAAPYRQNHPLRDEGRKIAEEYIDTVRKKRAEIYCEIAEKGLTTKKWVSEQKAYAIIKSLHPDAIYQYTSKWLGEQSIDIYIPSKRIAVEYQGLQHYQAVEHFGGKEGYEKTIMRDETKKEKCRRHGVKLIEWRFDEPLTENYIKNKIDNFISNSSQKNINKG